LAKIQCNAKIYSIFNSKALFLLFNKAGLVYYIDGVINEISADSAYDDCDYYEAIKNVEAQPLISLKANAIFWEQGHQINKEVMQLQKFKLNDNWKKYSKYHKKST
jgi:hypothetical protein